MMVPENSSDCAARGHFQPRWVDRRRRRQRCRTGAAAPFAVCFAVFRSRHAKAPGTETQRLARERIRAWYDAAEAMRRAALSRGDQPYGAVLVHRDRIIGEGPSRVVLRGDADAHAEREAIRDARERFGAVALVGSLLVSTSRPCRVCEAAAAEAGVDRMIHGPGLIDAGRPLR